jgi:hypothetical protein
MANKWIHPDVFDNGLGTMATLCATKTLQLKVIKAYAVADSYATVTGNIVASHAINLAAGDFVITTPGGTNNRMVTVAAKGVTFSADTGATPDTHVAIVNTTDSKVLAVWDETGDAVIATGEVRNVPAQTITFQMPT